MKKHLIVLMIFSAVFLLAGCDNSDREVSISLPSGEYYGEQHITISCVDPTAQIRYTLDGSDPKNSNLIYDSETGITVSFTSDLKATAGGNVAEAHYDIIPYDTPKDEAQQAFFNTVMGSWTTDETMTNTFNISSSSVTFQTNGVETKSGYFLKDVNGNSATLVYTDNQGQNVQVPISADPAAYSVTVNNVTYKAQWLFG